MTAGIAVSAAPNLWCAIPAAICSTFLMIGAITGWCPTNLLTGRSRSAQGANSLDYPEALQDFDLSRRR